MGEDDLPDIEAITGADPEQLNTTEEQDDAVGRGVHEAGGHPLEEDEG